MVNKVLGVFRSDHLSSKLILFQPVAPGQHPLQPLYGGSLKAPSPLKGMVELGFSSQRLVWCEYNPSCVCNKKCNLTQTSILHIQRITIICLFSRFFDIVYVEMEISHDFLISNTPAVCQHFQHWAFDQPLIYFKPVLSSSHNPVFVLNRISAFKMHLHSYFSSLVHLNEQIHKCCWVYAALHTLRDLEAYTYNHTTGNWALILDSGVNVLVWFQSVKHPLLYLPMQNVGLNYTYPCKILFCTLFLFRIITLYHTSHLLRSYPFCSEFKLMPLSL